MYILHAALGGCLTAPNVQFGITEDTGGHIAYILGAAFAQARRSDVTHVDIVTRAFDDPDLGAVHARLTQPVTEKVCIRRLATRDRRYLAKDALLADRPALKAAFARLLGAMPRRPDVIHAHFADAFAVVQGAAAEHGIPIVYTPHSLGIDKSLCLSSRPGPTLRARIAEERAALAHADGVVVSSRDEAERQVEAYDADASGRVHRLSPGVILPPSPPGMQAARDLVDPLLTQPERPMILAIARPVEKKNLVALVEAYLSHPDLKAQANLVILAGQRGPGIAQSEETRRVLSALESMAAQHAGAVALPERHGPEVVSQLYRLAAQRGGVFVNPACHEPFGLTLLEAAQAGLPVVATREGGPVDILGAIGHGTLVDPMDTAGIGRAVARFLRDRKAWARASAAGQRNVRAFDWDAWAAGAQRVYAGLRPRPRRRDRPRRILACDIDGTLTGCRTGAAAFSDWVRRRSIPFVVATGRSISEARGILAEWGLPEPEAFITAVGTELHRRRPDGRLSLCPTFGAQVSRGWDRATVLDVLSAAGATMQPTVDQRRWKLGCFGDAEEAFRLDAALRAAGVAARVVASHGRLIDVLAPQGGKAAAIASYAATFGLTLADCIAAGDSGNDEDMLTACGQAIVVGNAHPELDRLTARPGLYRAAARHAGGVLEGLGRLDLGRADIRRPRPAPSGPPGGWAPPSPVLAQEDARAALSS